MKTLRPPHIFALSLFLLTPMLCVDLVRAEPGCAGSVDPSFNANGPAWYPLWPPWASTPIASVTVQPDGMVVIAGGFSEVQGVPVNGMARLNADGVLDTNYVANPADVISHTNATQPDGKVLQIETVVIPGDPQEEEPSYSYTSYTTVVRFNTNGALDTYFTAALPTNFFPRVLALQPDGRVLVAGGVSDVTPFDQIFTVHQAVLRLNSNGSLDTTFSTNLTLESVSDAKVAIYDMVLQADGRIYIGGFFTAVNGVRRTDVARLNHDGSLDLGFEPDLAVRTGADRSDVETVSALGLAPDGKLVIAGFLNEINGVTRRGAARLHTAEDSCPGIITFTTAEQVVNETNGTVTVSMRRSGNTNEAVSVRYATAGMSATADADFGTQQGTVEFARGQTVQSFSVSILDDLLREPTESFAVMLGEPTGGTLLRTPTTLSVVILDDDNAGQPGSVDSDFQPVFNGDVRALAVQADGKIVVAGAFTTMNGVARDGLARLNPDATLDPTFSPHISGSIQVIAVMNAQVVIAGAFDSVNGQAVHNLARLNPDGSLDETFVAQVGGPVSQLVVQGNGQLMIAGAFGNVDGSTRAGLARLNSDGTLDPTFDAGAGPLTVIFWLNSFWTTNRGGISALAVQPDGKVLVGGSFNTVAGIHQEDLTRFNVDGSRDASFPFSNPYGLSWITALALQPDGKILVGGYFANVGGGGGQQSSLLRLNPDGTRDDSMNFAFGIPTSLVVQPDGKILIDGQVRLNADGSRDNNYFVGTGAEGSVSAVALQPDGKVLVGGTFIQVNGLSQPYLARFYNHIACQFDVHHGQPGHVVVSGPIGMRIIIEASTDLQNWMPLLTVTNDMGRIAFADPLAADFPQRFYRARECDSGPMR